MEQNTYIQNNILSNELIEKIFNKYIDMIPKLIPSNYYYLFIKNTVLFSTYLRYMYKHRNIKLSEYIKLKDIYKRNIKNILLDENIYLSYFFSLRFISLNYLNINKSLQLTDNGYKYIIDNIHKLTFLRSLYIQLYFRHNIKKLFNELSKLKQLIELYIFIPKTHPYNVLSKKKIYNLFKSLLNSLPNLSHLYLYRYDTIYYGDNANLINIKQNNKIDKLIKSLNKKYPNINIEYLKN